MDGSQIPDGRQQVAVDATDRFGDTVEEKRRQRLLSDARERGHELEDDCSLEVLSSLATCEQLPKDTAVGRFSTEPLSGELSRYEALRLRSAYGYGLDNDEAIRYAQLRREMENWELSAVDAALRIGVPTLKRAVRYVRSAGDASTTFHYLLRQSDDRHREQVLQLLEHGRYNWARRMATCGLQEMELECGDCSHHQSTDMHCDVPLCERCQNRRLGTLLNKYEDTVKDWDNPTFYTFAITNVSDPAVGDRAQREFLSKFRRRGIPFEGETVRDGNVKRWCWWRDNGKPADPWKSHLLENGRHDLVRKLEREYINYEYQRGGSTQRGRKIPVSELMQSGLYSIDVKQVGESEFNVHAHVMADSAWIPQAALSSVWEDVTGGSCYTYVQRISQKQGDKSERYALMETMAYAVKPPEFDTMGDNLDYLDDMKGSRKVQTFGALHGNAPVFEGLCCEECELVPRWWDVLGQADKVETEGGSAADGDRPPDTLVPPSISSRQLV